MAAAHGVPCRRSGDVRLTWSELDEIVGGLPALPWTTTPSGGTATGPTPAPGGPRATKQQGRARGVGAVRSFGLGTPSPVDTATSPTGRPIGLYRRRVSGSPDRTQPGRCLIVIPCSASKRQGGRPGRPPERRLERRSPPNSRSRTPGLMNRSSCQPGSDTTATCTGPAGPCSPSGCFRSSPNSEWRLRGARRTRPDRLLQPPDEVPGLAIRSARANCCATCGGGRFGRRRICRRNHGVREGSSTGTVATSRRTNSSTGDDSRRSRC